MNKKNILFSGVLFSIFIGTSILAILTAKKITTTQHTPSAKNPDFFMTDTIYTKFNREGKIRSRIRAKKVTHFAENNIYLFTKPNITIYNPNEKPWKITANHGKSRKGKTKVDLWDNVKIKRKAGTNNTDFDIATNALTIYLDSKFAHTKLPITILQSGNITKATGAEMDFKTGILKLIANVKAQYKIQ